MPNKNKVPSGYQMCQVWYLDKGEYTTGSVPRMLEAVDEEEDIKDTSGEEDTKKDKIDNDSQEEDVKAEYIDWDKGIGKANEADVKDGEDPIPSGSTRRVPSRRRIYYRDGLSSDLVGRRGPLPTCRTCQYKIERGDMRFILHRRYASDRSSTMYYHFKEACINGATLTPDEEDQAAAELGAAYESK
ncbi:hypothetical protein BGZ51_009474 [Haplosporangium sp. Z 767]|nr:hypothetical protein BGZ51_009474 [Haplosporangium sp. Z 767]